MAMALLLLVVVVVCQGSLLLLVLRAVLPAAATAAAAAPPAGLSAWTPLEPAVACAPPAQYARTAAAAHKNIC
jgi:hypothetical protein